MFKEAWERRSGSFSDHGIYGAYIVSSLKIIRNYGGQENIFIVEPTTSYPRTGDKKSIPGNYQSSLQWQAISVLTEQMHRAVATKELQETVIG